MAAPQRRWAAELLYVWFHTLRPRDWFQPGPRVDAMLRERFGHELAMLSPRPSAEFLSDPATALASVLLFDQIPRNLHRGSPQAFASDRLARAIAVGALDKGWNAALTLPQCQFLAMPLMHSEDISDQMRSLRFFGGLTLEETAHVLRVSVGTVRRDWTLAQAWLYRELGTDT